MYFNQLILWSSVNQQSIMLMFAQQQRENSWSYTESGHLETESIQYTFSTSEIYIVTVRLADFHFHAWHVNDSYVSVGWIQPRLVDGGYWWLCDHMMMFIPILLVTMVIGSLVRLRLWVVVFTSANVYNVLEPQIALYNIIYSETTP